MTFEEAVTYLKQGCPVRRLAWNKRNRINLMASNLHFTVADIKADDWMLVNREIIRDQVIQCPACNTFIELSTRVET